MAAMSGDFWIGVVHVHGILHSQCLGLVSAEILQDHAPLIAGNRLFLRIHVLLDDPPNHSSSFITNLGSVKCGK